MTSLYIGTSRLMRAANASGPSASTGRPSLAYFAFISGSARILLISFASLSTMGFGALGERRQPGFGFLRLHLGPRENLAVFLRQPVDDGFRGSRRCKQALERIGFCVLDTDLVDRRN